MAKKEENVLFVGISSGNDMRRDMLECSKGILESLKQFEELKDLKEKKTNLAHQFRGEVKNLSRLVNSLKNKLPKVKDAGIKRPDKQLRQSTKKQADKVEKPKGKTEIEKLEDELSEIENKLNSLD